MFKIGDFAQLGRVSTKMLRHYDELDLLKPAHVDSSNEYRYYSAEQLPQLNRIIVLKELGFSLQQIRELLSETLPIEQLQAMLRCKQAEVEQRIAIEQWRLAQISARLSDIAQEGHHPAYDVLVRHIEPVRVAVARKNVETEAQLPQLAYTVAKYLMNHQTRASGSTIVLHHTCDEAEVELELAVPVERELSATTEVCVEILPAVEQAACLVFAGTDQDVGRAYAALAQWMEAHKYEIARPTREVALQGGLAEPFHAKPWEQPYVIEIQFPLVASKV